VHEINRFVCRLPCHALSHDGRQQYIGPHYNNSHDIRLIKKKQKERRLFPITGDNGTMNTHRVVDSVALRLMLLLLLLMLMKMLMTIKPLFVRMLDWTMLYTDGSGV
jgi:hypothetical protein